MCYCIVSYSYLRGIPCTQERRTTLNKKLFARVVEVFIYSGYTMTVFLYKFGVTPRAIFLALLCIVVAVILSQIFLNSKICEGKRYYSSFFSVLAVWALFAFIYQWELMWYFFGFAIYIASELTYILLLGVCLGTLKSKHFVIAWRKATAETKKRLSK